MPTDLILLGILHTGEYYGYEIMKIIKSVMLEIADVTTGTLYYKLKGLEKNGLVTHSEEQDGKRPVRFRYTITDQGRQAFREMAQDHILKAGRAYWPVMPSLFFINFLDTNASCKALRERIDRLEAEITRLGKLRDHLQQEDYPFQADLIAHHGMEHIRIDINILELFIKQLCNPDLEKVDEAKAKIHFERFMTEVSGREPQ